MDGRQRGHARRSRHPYARPPARLPQWSGHQSARGHPRACPTCGIVRPVQNVATWTVISGQTSVGWVSRLPTEDQPVVPRALPAQEVPEPFRRLTLGGQTPHRTLRGVYAGGAAPAVCPVRGARDSPQHAPRELPARSTHRGRAGTAPPTNKR
ncbi:hypothetical protein MTO96_026393 [Rhipicephalus appendiculatus]